MRLRNLPVRGRDASGTQASRHLASHLGFFLSSASAMLDSALETHRMSDWTSPRDHVPLDTLWGKKLRLGKATWVSRGQSGRVRKRTFGFRITWVYVDVEFASS